MACKMSYCCSQFIDDPNKYKYSTYSIGFEGFDYQMV